MQLRKQFNLLTSKVIKHFRVSSANHATFRHWTLSNSPKQVKTPELRKGILFSWAGRLSIHMQSHFKSFQNYRWLFFFCMNRLSLKIQRYSKGFSVGKKGNPENKQNLKLIVKLKQSRKFGHVLPKGEYLDQWNWTEHPEINPFLNQSTDFGQLGTKTSWWKKIKSFQNVILG